MGYGFVVYIVPVGLLLFTLIHKPARRYFLPMKIIASVAFLVAAVYCGMTGQNLRLFFQMLPGFLFCFFGDVFLGFYNKHHDKKLFLVGLLTFFLGHVCFIGAFLRFQKFAFSDLIFPVAAVGITCITLKVKKMNLGKLKPFVCLYSFFVALLFAKSMHILWAMPGSSALYRAIGASLFLISDYLILFLYFDKKHPYTMHGWNLATYYIGMFFLAASNL